MTRKSKEAASGRFVVRIPPRLHKLLVAHAREEGVSMNLLVATLLAEGIGVHNGSKISHDAIASEGRSENA